MNFVILRKYGFQITSYCKIRSKSDHMGEFLIYFQNSRRKKKVDVLSIHSFLENGAGESFHIFSTQKRQVNLARVCNPEGLTKYFDKMKRPLCLLFICACMPLAGLIICQPTEPWILNPLSANHNNSQGHLNHYNDTRFKFFMKRP